MDCVFGINIVNDGRRGRYVVCSALKPGSKSGWRARRDHVYLAPAVIYFSSVLLLSALLSVPNQTRLTVVICICLEGITGLGYSGSLAIRRGASYESRSDLFPYAIFLLAAYALMVAGGLLLLSRPQRGLDLVAAGILVLLGIAIRNSWSIATTIVSS
jgi:hypothetical protein